LIDGLLLLLLLLLSKIRLRKIRWLTGRKNRGKLPEIEMFPSKETGPRIYTKQAIAQSGRWAGQK
jgi:hypothetical protein